MKVVWMLYKNWGNLVWTILYLYTIFIMSVCMQTCQWLTVWIWNELCQNDVKTWERATPVNLVSKLLLMGWILKIVCIEMWSLMRLRSLIDFWNLLTVILRRRECSLEFFLIIFFLTASSVFTFFKFFFLCQIIF